MTNAPLKPCPFCGSDAELVCGSPGCWFVLCKNCGAASDDGNKNFIVDRWNTRAETPPAPVAEDAVEALGRAMNPHIPDNDKLINAEIALAENVAERLAQRGYTLRRETMTDAELEKEAGQLAWMFGDSETEDQLKKYIENLAKKFRG